MAPLPWTSPSATARRPDLVAAALVGAAAIVALIVAAIIVHSRAGGGGPAYADVVRQGLAVHRQDESRESSTCGAKVDAACHAALTTALGDLRSFTTAMNGVSAPTSMLAEDAKLRRYVPAEADATQALIRAIDAGDQAAIGTQVGELISAQTQVDNAPDLAGR
jgi:hypothetical protein